MTTAHRPTFYNAVGGQNQGGNLLVGKSTKLSARDLPGQLLLKTRQRKPAPLYSSEAPEVHDDLDAEARRQSFRTKLEERTRQYQIKRAREEKGIHRPLEELPTETSEIFVNKVPSVLIPDQEENPFPEDSDDEGPGEMKNKKLPSGLSKHNSDNEDESGDDEEEEEALMRELEKIKKDREEEKRKKAEELARKVEDEERERALKANPLLFTDSSSDRLKRRWDDDVVFRNQVKDAPKPKKRFINDTVRSEFHRRFLNKYIQ